MPNKRKCKYCKSYTSDFIKTNAGTFCCFEHAIEWGKEKAARDKIKAANKQKKETKAKDRQRLKELKSRAQWYADLQKLVNQYVLHVRDKDKPCCTCGTTNNIKYDAGHFYTTKARPDIRFELTNIHKQCSQQCNVHGSGMRNEHEKFIIDTYGEDHLKWLEQEQVPLKEQFPTWQDIENEIKRYRKLIREAGLTPRY